MVVFLRAPCRGRVKTRLAREIGAAAALAFYRQTALATVHRLAADPLFETVLALVPERGARPDPWPRHLRRLRQVGQNLGDRMGHALSALGPGPVLVVGSDTQRGFSRLDQVSTGWVIGHIERVGRGLSMGCLASMGSCCPGLCAAAWFAAPSCRPWQTSWGLATVAKESEAETGQASHLSLPRPGCRAWRTSWRWRWSDWGPAAASSSSSEHPRQTPVWGPWQLATQPTMKLLLCCILPHTDQNVTHAYKQGRACKCGLHAAAIWLRERACDQLAACGTAPPVLHMPLGCQWQCTETPARN